MTKRKKDTMTGITMGGLIGLNVVGAIPSTSGDAGIRAGYSTGVSNVGSKLPTLGKLKGTGMVLKATGKLMPKKKKLFKFNTQYKGGRKKR